MRQWPHQQLLSSKVPWAGPVTQDTCVAPPVASREAETVLPLPLSREDSFLGGGHDEGVLRAHNDPDRIWLSSEWIKWARSMVICCGVVEGRKKKYTNVDGEKWTSNWYASKTLIKWILSWPCLMGESESISSSLLSLLGRGTMLPVTEVWEKVRCCYCYCCTLSCSFVFLHCMWNVSNNSSIIITRISCDQARVRYCQSV